MPARQISFLFDLDGTLVDSVYQHVLAWHEAVEAEGIELSVWRIHRRIGMSGGLFTNMLLRGPDWRSSRSGSSGCANSMPRPTGSALAKSARCPAPGSFWLT